MRRFLLPIALLFLVSGCVHNLSDKSRAQADRSVTYSALQKDPEAYRGKVVLLGGILTHVTPVPEGTLLEVEQHDLDSREMPDRTVPSGGRFLAATSEFLDVTCRPGVMVSLTGEVTGKKIQRLKGVDYTYPLIAIREMHLFPAGDMNPAGSGTWRP